MTAVGLFFVWSCQWFVWSSWLELLYFSSVNRSRRRRSLQLPSLLPLHSLLLSPSSREDSSNSWWERPRKRPGTKSQSSRRRRRWDLTSLAGETWSSGLFNTSNQLDQDDLPEARLNILHRNINCYLTLRIFLYSQKHYLSSNDKT